MAALIGEKIPNAIYIFFFWIPAKKPEEKASIARA